MNNQRLLAVSLMAALLLLVGCGAPPPTPASAPTAVPANTPATTPEATPVAAATSTSASTASASPATPAVATTKTLKVAINAAFKPFVFMDDSGKLAGFDIDLLNALGEAADIEVAYVNTSITDLLDGVASGAYDAAISAITVTPARQERVDFTTPYFRTGQAPVSFFGAGQGLAVAAGNTAITGTASLDASRRVGVKQGTTGADFVASATTAQAAPYPEAEQALAGLSAGEVDAVVLDVSILADYMINHPGAIMLVGGPVTEEEYAIAVNKQRPEVLAMLNDALAAVQANGAYDRLLQKWFGAP